MSEQSDAHRSHAAITMRLKRADGHLRGIVEMIADFGLTGHRFR